MWDSDDEPPNPLLKVHELLREGKLDAMRAFIAEFPASIHINSPDFEGPPLESAIRRHNVEAVRVLLDSGASPLEELMTAPYRDTLQLAAVIGNRHIMRLLLGRLRDMQPTGIMIANMDEDELVRWAFFAAAARGRVGVMEELLDMSEYSHEVMLQALSDAANRWEADTVDFILDRFQFERSDLVKVLPEAMEGKDMLMDEERCGVQYDESDWDKHYRVVSRLIDASGVDVREAEHVSPLLRRALPHIEKQGGLRALLDKGVDPNIQWENGYTSLHLLASPIRVGGWLEVKPPVMHEVAIRLLVEKGASLTIRDDEGATASHWAAERSDAEIFLHYYKPADTDLWSTNKDGETLLHYAAAGGKHETIKYLMSRGGFDVNAIISNSWTPLICALAPNGRMIKGEANAVRSARLLLQHGADPRAVTTEGWTILHVVGSYQDRSFLDTASPDDEIPEDEVPEDEILEDKVSEGKDGNEAEGEDTSAATLLRELFSGAWDLPPIESPANVHERAPSQARRFTDRDHWGARLSKMLKDGDEWSKTKWSSDVEIIQKRTPLHWAAERGALGVVRVLRERGANQDAEDSEGQIPWQLAFGSRFIWSDELRWAIKKALE